MRFDPTEVTLFDVKDLLDEHSLNGPRRHLLIELFLVQGLREWERPCSEEHFLEVLDVPPAEGRELLRVMAHADLITCAQDLKTGQISGIDLSDAFVDLLKKRQVAQRAAREQHHHAVRGPRPPTDGVKRRTHELFEDICELCGDRAVRGKDQHGHRMRVARIKKDLDGVAENVTLLCSKCSNESRGRDLPDNCRTLRMLQIAEERGYEHTPRTAEPLPKPLKEVVLVARGHISVKTRNLDLDQTSQCDDVA